MIDTVRVYVIILYAIEAVCCNGLHGEVIGRPQAARARSAILEYFEAAAVMGQQPIFVAAEAQIG